jgi:hypothetical protein
MTIKAFISFTVLACGFSSIVLQLGSQPLPPEESKFYPETVANLLKQQTDFRHYFFTADKISSRRDRDMIFLIRRHFDPSIEQEEHSAQEWTNVSAMLKSLNYLERSSRYPQIRIVQRNAIIQSDMEHFGNGYDNRFLDWPLSAGDVVSVSPRIRKE